MGENDLLVIIWGIISIRADVIVTGVVIHTAHIYRQKKEKKNKPKVMGCEHLPCSWCKLREVSPKVVQPNSIAKVV